MATGSLDPVVRYLRKVTSPTAPAQLPDAEQLSRFVQQREEAAFTALVRRHGPMVLAVCRRVLRDEHAAEDAFQAVFLVLARKAASLAQPERLGSWLYGVAYRTARKARRETAKRRAHEAKAVRVQEVGPCNESERQDLSAVLDEEVNRLPERYRVPVVLCYLQGQTNAEACRRLGCSRGTIATLLARARDKLRRRLTQRGIGLSAGFTLAALTPILRGGMVPLALENVTVKAAALLSAGHTQAAAALAAQAIALAKGVSKGMLLEKLRIPVAILVVTALVGTGAGVGVYRAGATESEVTESAAEAKPRTSDKTERQKPIDEKRSDEPVRQLKPRPASVAKRSLQEEPPLPTGPAPFQVLVGPREDGRLCVIQTVVSYQPVTEVVTLKNGRKVPISTYEEKHSYRAMILPIDKVRVYDTKGRKLDVKVVRKRLIEAGKQTVALFSANGRPVDPLHLRLYKEDTLLFVYDSLEAALVPHSPPAPVIGVPAAPIPVAPPAVGIPVLPSGEPLPAAPAPRPVSPLQLPDGR